MNRARTGPRIGVLVPFTNVNLEPDMALLAPADATVHVARMGGYDADAVPDSAQMAGLGEADLDGPLGLLAGVGPDVVLYGCTSATLAHGPAFDRALAARVAALTGAASVTAAGALVDAIRSLGARRIGFASPYVPELNDCAVAFLAASGIDTVGRADVEDFLSNEAQSALSPDEVRALGIRADSARAEVVVLSCTDMRAVEVIGQLEAYLGKPVVTSNQAMVWAAMRALGRDPGEIGLGRLMQRRATV